MSNSVYTSPVFSNANSYVAKQWLLFLCFNMSTFVGNESFDPSTSPNVFNPTNISVDQWLTVPDLAGGLMRPVLLTTKAHDGFCLWPTATTAHSIASSSWYATGFDIVSQFTTKARAKGLLPVIYWSVWDKWFEANNPGYTQAQYRTYLETQLTELLTNYGSIFAIWIDGAEWQFGSSYPWDSAAQRNNFIKGLQPSCYVIDNSHTFTDDSDILIYEGGSVQATIPVGNTAPAEFVETVKGDNTWYYKAGDTPKTYLQMLTILNRTNGRGAALNMSIPIDTTGRVPSAYTSLVSQMAAFRAA